SAGLLSLPGICGSSGFVSDRVDEALATRQAGGYRRPLVVDGRHHGPCEVSGRALPPAACLTNHHGKEIEVMRRLADAALRPAAENVAEKGQAMGKNRVRVRFGVLADFEDE